MRFFNYWYLQLFAEGGGDGAGATGDNSSQPAAETASTDDNEARLAELGVPADKIAAIRTVKRTAKVKAAPPVEDAQEAEAEQAEQNKQPETAKQERMSWRQIMADPEYNAEMQKVVQARIKDGKKNADTLTALQPMLDLLSETYGVDGQDAAALAKAVLDDNRYYEERAMRDGVSIETAKQLDTLEREKRIADQRQQESLEQQMFQNHIAKLGQQAEALKAQFPDFDLQAALRDPTFARLTAPGVGLSVEDAYHAMHWQEISRQQAAQIQSKTEQNLSKSIRSNASRPREAGTRRQAPSSAQFNPRSMSDEQFRNLTARIKSGERVMPGHEF